MKHKDFGECELHFVQRWIRVIREVSGTHVFKDSEDKEEGGEVAVESDAHETPINGTNREDINALLSDGYRVHDDRLPAPENKPSTTGDTERPVYK